MPRPPGSLNRKTLQRHQLLDAMTAANATPLSFFLAVMKSESPLISMDQRIAAARGRVDWRARSSGPAPGVHRATVRLMVLNRTVEAAETLLGCPDISNKAGGRRTGDIDRVRLAPKKDAY
jgi:hypothetical protein